VKRDRFKTDMQVKYVYPNVCELNRKGRGSLYSRHLLAEQTGCSLVEMPADLIKNKTECELTGLVLGSFLDQQAIRLLYESPVEPHDIKYVLHTEPSLPRTDGFGLNHQAQLKWYDQDWVDHLIQMIISISERLKAPSVAIEIHPGDRRNSQEDLIGACREILTRYGTAFGKKPQILLENRTAQFISTGSELADFWEALAGKPGNLADSVGIVLDIQQLFTVTGRDFGRQFEMIPLEAIKGLHVHTRHRTPSLQDSIPWRRVFVRIQKSEVPLLINPEIHHSGAVPEALKFCKSMLE
jgi:hypothetical protein